MTFRARLRHALPLLLVAAALPAGAAAQPSPERAAQEAQDALDVARQRGTSVAAARELLERQARAPELAERGKSETGAAFGSVWIDQADGGRLKLGVAGEGQGAKAGAGRAIAQAGLVGAADVVSVSYSEAQLAEVSDWLLPRVQAANEGAAQPLTFGTRVDDNVVELKLPRDGGLSAAQRALVSEATELHGKALRLASHDGAPQEFGCSYPFCTAPLRAGIRIGHDSFAGGGLCTGSFLSRGRGANNYLFQLTAGHCDHGAGDWRTRQVASGPWIDIGPRHNFVESSQGDAGIYRVVDNAFWTARSWVYVTSGPDTTSNGEYRIYSDAPSTLGQRICSTGSYYGRSDCGDVVELNFFDGQVGGLVRTDSCGTFGDSGAPMYAYGTAYGILRGGGGSEPNCEIVYTPAQTAENMMNVDITHATN